MKLFRKKKRVKGITLIECIIALAVLAVAGTVMARIVTVSCQIMRNTNRMNNKLIVESPAASIQAGQNKDFTTSPPIDKYRVGDIEVEDSDVEDVQITVTSGSNSTTYNAKKYDTWALAKASDRDCYTGSDPTQTERDGNLQFYAPAGQDWQHSKVS